MTLLCLHCVLGIDEADSKGCGAVLFDLLMRLGISVQPSMIPEKKLIYEIIKLMKTHIFQPQCRMSLSQSNCKKVTTKVTQKKVEHNMHYNGPPTTAGNFLTFIDQVHVSSIDPVPKELNNNVPILDSNDDAVDEDKLLGELHEFEQSEQLATQKGNRKLHPLLTTDGWQTGRESFEKRDILGIRKMHQDRLQ